MLALEHTAVIGMDIRYPFMSNELHEWTGYLTFPENF